MTGQDEKPDQLVGFWAGLNASIGRDDCPLALSTGKAHHVCMIGAGVPEQAEDGAASELARLENVATRDGENYKRDTAKIACIFCCFRPFHYL